MGNLPALDTESDKVQDVHFKYLDDLVSSGVDGFRFDCAQWMKPDIMKKYFNSINNKWSYLEVIEQRNINRIQTYNKIGPISDYNLGIQLANIFSNKNSKWRDDIKKFPDMVEPDNVVFAVNHDTYHSKQSRLSLKFYDNNDRSTEIIATILLLVMKKGVPLIFRETNKNNMVQDAVKFRKDMYEKDADEYKVFSTNQSNIVVLSRGHHGFCIINKGRKKTKVNGIFDYYDGEFYELNNKENVISIKNGKLNTALYLEGKSAQFFVSKTTQIKNKLSKDSIFSSSDFPTLARSNYT